MTRRRFYAPPEAFARDGALVTLSEEESRHLRDVLRLRAGDEAHVFDGAGREFACVVRGDGGRKGRASLEVRGPAEPPSPESPLALALAVALLKGEKFDLVVQKATELGVSLIAPVVTKRSDVRPRDERDAVRRVERWRRLALEASKQSGRAFVPAVAAPAAFDTLIEKQDETALRLLFAERGGAGLDTLVDETHARPASAVALVGPEGGWDDEELAHARARGWTLVTLGGRTLRAETAAIAVCVLLQHLFGDLR
ncbi:MAG TPA: 16S rRNA (uracil(1498)-N(3))-methyltransferase [Pyrinomonadaceae bacterium]|nr:16S rRNA (uracil(1498)-N(3))-methyltransferase [Pyrinomonadaceae bacterium]